MLGALPSAAIVTNQRARAPPEGTQLPLALHTHDTYAAVTSLEVEQDEYAGHGGFHAIDTNR